MMDTGPLDLSPMENWGDVARLVKAAARFTCGVANRARRVAQAMIFDAAAEREATGEALPCKITPDLACVQAISNTLDDFENDPAFASAKARVDALPPQDGMVLCSPLLACSVCKRPFEALSQGNARHGQWTVDSG